GLRRRPSSHDAARFCVKWAASPAYPASLPTRRSSDLAAGALQQAAVQIEHVAGVGLAAGAAAQQQRQGAVGHRVLGQVIVDDQQDRKSTRLNSSHVSISYAVFCLKKKKRIISDDARSP